MDTLYQEGVCEPAILSQSIIKILTDDLDGLIATGGYFGKFTEDDIETT